MLQRMVPPTIKVFETLPFWDRLDRDEAIYLLVLEENGHRSKIYIGPSTHARQDDWTRMRSDTSESNLPERRL